MNTELAVALVTTSGVVLVALVGVLVELVRNRKRQDRVVAEVTPNGGSSLRDAVARIEAELKEVRQTVGRQGERLAGLESLADRVLERRRR